MSEAQIPFDPDFDKPKANQDIKPSLKPSLFAGASSKLAFWFGLAIGFGAICFLGVIFLLSNRGN
ncbi:hypothetical protein C4546_00020 [Candidatus Parcubacteria bacterium]|jgi:hypothetical protein|nr:MAG: hypothetical protein C4546_00020 [Candidatus Parcubacteria bacterium]